MLRCRIFRPFEPLFCSYRIYLLRFIKLAFTFFLLSWIAHSLWFFSLPRTELEIGSHKLRVIVADSPMSLTWGLMFRFALNDDEGMLFVFPNAQRACLWMKNTFIPLSVAFIHRDGVIESMSDMHPLTLRSHCAPVPVSYALEVPQNWFGAHSVIPGWKIIGLPIPPQ